MGLGEHEIRALRGVPVYHGRHVPEATFLISGAADRPHFGSAGH